MDPMGAFTQKKSQFGFRNLIFLLGTIFRYYSLFILDLLGGGGWAQSAHTYSGTPTTLT